MRGKDDAIGQAKDLLNLGRMAMLAYAIGLQVLVGAAKMGAGVAGLTGARHAANGIDNHRTVLGHPAGAHGGRGGKARCGGIATGAGDQHGFAVGMVGCGGLQVLAEQLGQAESAGLEQLGARMLGGIPRLEHGRIAQAVVGRQVEAGNACGKQCRHLCHGGGVRHGQKDSVAGFKLGSIVRREDKIAHASKARIHRGQRLAGIGVGRNGNKFKLGMTEHEANELGSGISSRADDSNLQRHIRLLVCDLCTDAHFAAVVMKWVETLAPKDALTRKWLAYSCIETFPTHSLEGIDK